MSFDGLQQVAEEKTPKAKRFVFLYLSYLATPPLPFARARAFLLTPVLRLRPEPPER